MIKDSNSVNFHGIILEHNAALCPMAFAPGLFQTLYAVCKTALCPTFYALRYIFGGIKVENNHYCPHLSQGTGEVRYSADSNLIFLREDLADELGAVIGYLECAALAYHSKVSEQFSRIAGEEAGHFIRLMQMISSLDPVQAEQLKQQELTVLTLVNDGVKPPETFCGDCSHSKDHRISEHKNYPKEKYEKSNIKDLELLGNAIRDELRAVNAYQKQVQITANQSIQNLLIIIMNQEKEHLAKYVRIFHDLQH